MPRVARFALALTLLTIGSHAPAHADGPAGAPNRAWLPALLTAGAAPTLTLTHQNGTGLGGPSSGVAIEGDRAYQVQGGRLQVWDISSPEAARVVGQVDLPEEHWPGTIQVSGGTVAVLQQKGCGAISIEFPEPVVPCVTLSLVDVRDPSSPRLSSRVPLSGQRATMSSWGDRLFVATVVEGPGPESTSELLAVGIADPAAPVMLSKLGGLPGLGPILAGRDRLAVCTDQDGEGSGMRVYDIRKNALRMTDEQRTDVDCVDLATVGERLWMLSWRGEVVSWLWRDGARFDHPKSAWLETATLVVDEMVDLSGQLCTFDGQYESIRTGLMGRRNQLACFDVADPGAPTLAWKRDIASEEALKLAHAAGHRLVLSAWGRGALVIVESGSDGEGGQWTLDPAIGAAFGMFRKDDQLFTFELDGLVRRWPMGKPIVPSSRGQALAPAGTGRLLTIAMGDGPAGRWLVQGEWLPVAFSPRLTLAALDLAESSAPSSGPAWVEWGASTAYGAGMAASGDLVWFDIYDSPFRRGAMKQMRVTADGFVESHVPDLDAMSDRVLWLESRPVVVSAESDAGGTLTVIEEDYATVMARLDGLGPVGAAAIVGHRAYIATNRAGLRDSAQLTIVDLADPVHPAHSEPIDLPLAEVALLLVSESRVLVYGAAARPIGIVANVESALCSLAIADPAAPDIEGCTQSPPRLGGPTEAALSPDGHQLYTLGDGGKLMRFDVGVAGLQP